MSNQGLEITEVNVFPVKEAGETRPLRAFAKVVLNGQFLINSIRIIKGSKGLFIAFPGEYDPKEKRSKDFCFPIDRAVKEAFTERILAQYSLVSQGRRVA